MPMATFGPLREPGYDNSKQVRSEDIVLLSPLLDDHLRFLQGVEDSAVQEYDAQLDVEALDVAVFPRTAWFDK